MLRRGGAGSDSVLTGSVRLSRRKPQRREKGDQGTVSSTILVTGEGGMDQGGGRGGGRKWSDSALILNRQDLPEG